MILRVRAEWIKAPKVLLGVLAALAALFGLANSVVAQEHAFGQHDIADWYRAQMNNPQTTLDHPKLHQPFVEKMRQLEESAAHTQSVPGAFDFNSGLFATAPGFVVIGLVAAVVVAREWDQRTATGMFLADPSLWRTVAGKTAMVWLVSLGIFVITSLVTGLFGITVGNAVWPLESVASGTFLPGLGHVALAVVTMLFFSLVSTVLAVLLGNRLRTVFVTVLATGVLVMATSIPGLSSWTPFGLVLESGGYVYMHGVWDHFVYSVQKAGGSVQPYTQLFSSTPLVLRILATLVAAAAFTWSVVTWRRKRGLVS